MRGIATGGSRGPAGANGVGVPVGGTSGQVLAKNSNTDFDTAWIDQATSNDPNGVSVAYIGEQLFRQVVGAGGQASFDITSIPAGYDHLEISIQGKTAQNANDYIHWKVNDDATDANYKWARSFNGVQSGGGLGDTRQVGCFSGGGTFGAGQIKITITNYDSNLQYKTAISLSGGRSTDTTQYVMEYLCIWENTAPITKLSLYSGGGANFLEGTLCTVVGYKNREMSQSEIPDTVQGRLTLTAGTAVTTSDVTAATTLYFTPFNGNKIHLYTNGSWVLHSYAETSISLAGLTANTNFDVFAYSNSGTLALELLTWTGDTTRTTELSMLDGIYVKSGDATRRYLGTIRTTAVTGQCEDSVTKRLVWNQYNQMPKKLWKAATAAPYVYHGDWRAWENDITNRFEVVCGIAGETITIRGVTTIVTGNKGGYLGVGINSTSVNSAIGNLSYSSTIEYQTPTAYLVDYPRVGYSYYQALEKSQNAGPSWEGTSWLGGYGGQWKA